MSRSLIGRRAWLGAALAAGAASGLRGARAAEAPPPVRLGVLQFGTVQWVAEVIRRNRLDVAHGFTLQTEKLANGDAGRIALMAGAVDVVVSDWMMVASQRAAGRRLSFTAFSATLGGIMVRADSPIRRLSDLKGRKLGVAGGPVDKSWLLVRAAAQQEGIDLAATANIVYGAPPLLSGKFIQGDLDAVLTYWTFAARLRAAGYREVRSVAACAEALGLPARLALVGFVFHEDWATRNRPAIDGFLKAAAAAERRLAADPAEFQAIRPLMNAPDEALYAELSRRFVDGITHPAAEEEQRSAEQVFAILSRTGGKQATAGLSQLPSGMFWPVARDA
ncbi:MAG TPA: ABC transporter substrate-binding protein [Acetobacteraceae bacterium]|nr:ABC transporter substrate-binding protein [Acetobacteraceae bacterium]